MRHLFFAVIGALVLFGSSGYVFAHDAAKMQEIFNNPSVVKLWAIGPAKAGTGSANIVVYNDKRYYLTNAHVVKDSLRIWVSRPDSPDASMEEVRIVGIDPIVDLALVTESDLTKNLPAIVLGDSGQIKIGEEVYALGYPFGSRTVTTGNITALELPYPFFILSQAPINPGNSGGPLFNGNNEMIAMNTAIRPGNLIAFSIPINLVKQLFPRLTSERLVKHGILSDLGTYDSRSLVPFAFDQLGLTYPPSRHGSMVISVEGTASSAGFVVGDIITKLDGIPISSEKELELLLFLKHKPDENVTVTVLRGAKEIELKTKLVELQQTSSAANQPPSGK